jgi:hypothetical protein
VLVHLRLGNPKCSLRFWLSATDSASRHCLPASISNVASRLCDEAKPGQILISPRVLTKVENAVKVEPAGEFELKGIRRPLAAFNVVDAVA